MPSLRARQSWMFSILAAMLCGPVLAFGTPAQAAAPSSPVAASSALANPCAGQSGWTLVGNAICDNQSKFIARGVVFEGFQYPLEAMQNCVSDPADFVKPTTEPERSRAIRFCQRRLDARDYYWGAAGTRYSGTSPGLRDPNIQVYRNALTRSIVDWNTNTIRFNVSEALLDPASPLANKPAADRGNCNPGITGLTDGTWGCNYYADIVNAVRLASDNGQLVIVAMFTARLAGAENVLVYPRSVSTQSYNQVAGSMAIPTGATKSAIKNLAYKFQGDRVFLEIFNEPTGAYRQANPGAENDYWGNGNIRTCYVQSCGSSKPGVTYPGVLNIIDAARNQGYNKPIVVMGLDSLLDQSLRNDIPASYKVIFASHPFLGEGKNPFTGRRWDGGEWTDFFGYTNTTRPVMVTAWEASSHQNNLGPGQFWCEIDPNMDIKFLDYIRDREIGVYGFGFDVEGGVTAGFQTSEPPSLYRDRAVCDPTAAGVNGNVGKVMWQRFNNLGLDAEPYPWTSQPGLCRDIGASSAAAWCIGFQPGAADSTAFKWNGSTWVGTVGVVNRISVGPDGSAWAVHSDGRIYHSNVDGTQWTQLPGLARDIGVGSDGSVWIIGYGDPDSAVFKWNGSGWETTAGIAQRIAVGPNGWPWVVHSNGQVFRSGDGGQSWNLLPGSLTDIGVGANGAVWGIGTSLNPQGGGRTVYHWIGATASWNLTAGGLTGIAVGGDGSPWGVNDAGNVFTGVAGG